LAGEQTSLGARKRQKEKHTDSGWEDLSVSVPAALTREATSVECDDGPAERLDHINSVLLGLFRHYFCVKPSNVSVQFIGVSQYFLPLFLIQEIICQFTRA